MMLNIAVLTKELRTRMRGRRAAVIITVYLLLLATAGALVMQLERNNLQFNFNAATAARTGTNIFAVLAMLQMALVVFIVPGLTGASIAGERDRQTLDLLLSTQVSSLGVVLGKLLASLSYVLLLLVASLPIFSLVFLFGGVSPVQVAGVFTVSLVTALMLGSIGVLLSTWLRRGQLATIATYATTFILILGTLGISAYLEASNIGVYRGVPGSVFQPSGQPWTPYLFPLVFNPFMGLVDLIPSIGVPFSRGGRLSLLSLWQANLVADAAIILVCVWLSTMLMRPGGRRVPWRRPVSPGPVDSTGRGGHPAEAGV